MAKSRDEIITDNLKKMKDKGATKEQMASYRFRVGASDTGSLPEPTVQLAIIKENIAKLQEKNASIERIEKYMRAKGVTREEVGLESKRAELEGFDIKDCWIAYNCRGKSYPSRCRARGASRSRFLQGGDSLC